MHLMWPNAGPPHLSRRWWDCDWIRDLGTPTDQAPYFFCLSLRQRSEQYFTSSQQRSHFFRQANGLPQTAQFFEGR